MAHIDLPEGLPGIIGPMTRYADTEKPLNELAQVLLRGNQSTLSPGERELIATYVSSQNDCLFCQSAHGATAAHLIEGSYSTVEAVKTDYQMAPVSDKLKALLVIAGKVQKGGRNVTEADVSNAREHGATDRDIHDTVLISAAFCMFNRYVDGLATWAPEDPAIYDQIGGMLASVGYVESIRRDQPEESNVPS